MSKRPTDGDEPPAKKRASSRQMTKDDASDDEVSFLRRAVDSVNLVAIQRSMSCS